MSKEMFDILIDAIDAQNEHIQDDLDPDDWQPMRAKLQDIKEGAQAAQGAAKAA